MTNDKYALFVANWVYRGGPTAEDFDTFLCTGERPAFIAPAPDLHGLGENITDITDLADIVETYDRREITHKEAVNRLAAVFRGSEDERKENAIALCLRIDEHQAIAWLRDFRSLATIGYTTRRYQTREEFEKFTKRTAESANAVITWLDA